MHTITRAALWASTLVFGAASALAAPIFTEDFESGLIGTNWAIPGSAATVADPLRANNQVVNFNLLAAGGDLRSRYDLAPGSYHLSLDILGTCGGTGNCGGFVGIDQPGEIWLIGDTSYASSLTVTNTGAWQHIDLMFTATGTFRLKLEDYTSTTATPRDVYFDNICISAMANDPACPATRQAVPEPLTLALVGLGLVGIAASRRRRSKT